MKIRSVKYLCGEGFRNVWSHRLMSAASAGVLIACMLMIGLVWALSMNIDNYVEGMESKNVVMVFFEDDLSRKDAQKTSDEIAKYENIKSVEFISREEGLENLKKTMGEEYAELLDLYTNNSNSNPIPDSCKVTVKNSDVFDSVQTKLKDSTDGVQRVDKIGNNMLLVYFDNDLSREDAMKASDEIAKYENIDSAEFISREKCNEILEETLGEEYTELLELYTKGTSNNPLPDGCKVTVDDLKDFDATYTKLEKFTPGVQIVRSSKDTVEQLTTIRSIINIVGFGIIGILLIISLVIVSNTIKITMYTRKLEINIMKAVGATNRFIRLPFVIEGMVLGVFSGICSTGILYLLYKITEKAFATSFDGANFVPFTSFAWPLFAAFVVIGAVVGALGSVFSIGKYLRHEGSEFNALV